MKNFLKTSFKKNPISLIFIVTFLFFLSLGTTYAKYIPGGANGEANYLDEYKQALEEPDINLPQWSLYNMKYITKGLNRLLIGIPVLKEEEASRPGGALGIFVNLINGIYQNKPVSSGQYFAYLGERLNLIKPAYAQGEGWARLSSILKIWKGLRDITYLFFVIIFVALGFMIMFRRKIDPQTVISIQSAIPKIIISLILITFSFAICGLMVDIIFFSNELLKAIFVPIMRPEFNYIPTTDIFSVVGKITGVLVKPAYSVPVLGYLGTFFNALGKIFNNDFADIFNIIIAIIILTTVMKIFISLISRYAMILIYTIFSPLIILWGSLPEQQDHLANFFRSFIGNIIVFPATVLMLNIADYLFTVGPTLIPPLQTIPPLDMPHAAETPSPLDATILAGFLGLGVIMATARLPEIIDDALKTKPTIAPTLGTEVAGVLKRIPVIGSFI